MAGEYADVPGHRMAWDKDGAQLYWIDNAHNFHQLSESVIADLNDESDSTSWENTGTWGDTETGYLMVLFPEKRDLAGLFLAATIGEDQAGVKIQTGVETTDGIDGTWVTIEEGYTVPTTTKPGCRSAIRAYTASGINAIMIRFVPVSGGVEIFALHLFGTPSTGSNPERLAIWHPTLDQPAGASHFDWGDAPRKSSDDVWFRVKNISARKRAINIICGLNALTDTTPSVPAQHLLSADQGQEFAATVLIDRLDKGEISSTIILRRNTPAAAVLSQWAVRLYAVAESWFPNDNL